MRNSSYSKVETSGDEIDTATMNNDTVPLLMASPLPYGTEPETVTFDESAIPFVIPATAERIDNVNNSDRYNSHQSQQHHHHQHQDDDDDNNNNDPLIRPTLSADYSATAMSDKPELPVFRDVPFAIFFWLQLIVMILLGIYIAPQGYNYLDFQQIDKKMRQDPDTTSSDLEEFETSVTFVAQYFRMYAYRIVFYSIVPAGLMAFFIGLIAMTTIIRPYPKCMVTFCLLGAFVDTGIVLLIIVINSGSIGFLILSIMILSVVAYYVRSAWRLIPYSAVNLGVSLEGIQSNCGIYMVALALAKIGICWAFYWFYTMIGVMIYVGETQCPGGYMSDDDDDCSPQGMAFFFLLLSFYWTIQVITNTIQVTVAGVFATWAFDYDSARGCCSPAIWSSLFRTFTFSFGSICFGSLLLGIVRVLRYFIQNAKKQRDSRTDNCDGGEMFLCVLNCLISFFDEILEYFNHWSFVFCGIYGTSYLQSGKMVVELFRARGWETFISDDLIGYVLAFTTFTVGIMTGLSSSLLEWLLDSQIQPDPVDKEKLPQNILEFWDSNKSFLFGPLPNPTAFAFGIGCFTGIIVCSIMMSVVRGSVNTLIVCWADSPARLEANHPDSTKEMAETWSYVFPEARINLPPTVVVPVASPEQSESHR